MATKAARRAAAQLVAGLLTLAACREGASLFVAADRESRAGESPLRLTYGPGEDRAPAWSPGGDSIYYGALTVQGLPRPIGVLRALPAEGGAARPILGAVQAESAARRWLVSPVPSPDGTRIAYVEVWSTTTQDMCSRAGVSVCEWPFDTLAPFMAEGRLRVREVGAVGPVDQDPILPLSMAHVDLDRDRRPFASDGVHIYRAHPFQTVWRTEGTPFYRPSWSPDGQRIVISDGLRLLLWGVGDAAPVAVPGTEDGISPAWSPTGEWIAFTRLVRADSAFNRCIQYAEGEPFCMTERYTYTIGGRELVLVRPDGSGLRVLGEGEDAAWAPDGATLYFRAADRLWRRELSGGEPRELPGTTAGREPAVSPDGTSLAYTRGGPGDADIWVLRLGTP